MDPLDYRSRPLCLRCGGEGREDSDDGWTVVCRRCHGTGINATRTEGNT